MIQLNSKKILRIRMLVNTGPGIVIPCAFWIMISQLFSPGNWHENQLADSINYQTPWKSSSFERFKCHFKLY